MSLVAHPGESDLEFARRLQAEDIGNNLLIQRRGTTSNPMGTYSGGIRHLGTSISGSEDEGLMTNVGDRDTGAATRADGFQEMIQINHQQQRLNELYTQRIEMCFVITVNIPQIIAALIILPQSWPGTVQSHCDQDHVTRWIIWSALSVLRIAVQSVCMYMLNNWKEWLEARPRILSRTTNLKNVVELFQLIWFVVGNMWLFGEQGRGASDAIVELCPHPGRSPTYRLAVAMLVINYLQICLPCLVAIVLIPIFCFCMPCLIRLVARLHGGQLGASRGASDASIHSLPVVVITEEVLRRGCGAEGGELATPRVGTNNNNSAIEAQACPICLTDLQIGDEARLLTCKHLFHRACVDEWLHVNATCPTCRKAIFQPPEAGANNAEQGEARGSGSGVELLASPRGGTDSV
jgi:hypothetical protein